MDDTPTKRVVPHWKENKGKSACHRGPRTCVICNRDLVTMRKYTCVKEPLAQQLKVLTGIKEVDFSLYKICCTCVKKVHDSESFATELQGLTQRFARQSTSATSTPTRLKRMIKTSESPSTSTLLRRTKVLKETSDSVSEPSLQQGSSQNPMARPGARPRKKLGFTFTEEKKLVRY